MYLRMCQGLSENSKMTTAFDTEATTVMWVALLLNLLSNGHRSWHVFKFAGSGWQRAMTMTMGPSNDLNTLSDVLLDFLSCTPSSECCHLRPLSLALHLISESRPFTQNKLRITNYDYGVHRPREVREDFHSIPAFHLQRRIA
jgi:hypothetical protein